MNAERKTPANIARGLANGLIHDWAAATVASGMSVEKVLGVLQNYAAYKTVYAPEVEDAGVLRHDGNNFHIFMKLVKKKAITVKYNTESDVEYRPLGGGRWAVISRSTRVPSSTNRSAAL